MGLVNVDTPATNLKRFLAEVCYTEETWTRSRAQKQYETERNQNIIIYPDFS